MKLSKELTLLGITDKAAVREVRKILKGLSRAKIEALTARLHGFILKGKRTYAARTTAVKALVALLPGSLPAIAALLTPRREPRWIVDVRFTLFCHLDEGLEEVRDVRLTRTCVGLIGDYLSTVRRESAYAAWMAGDLLGDHINLKHSLPVLLKVAQTGRFVAGRLGALHGLAHAMARGNERQRSHIVSILDRIQRGDRSARVRREAVDILTGKHPCAWR